MSFRGPKLPWNELKNLIDFGGYDFGSIGENGNYWIWCTNGEIVLWTYLTDSAEISEYEDNYQSIEKRRFLQGMYVYWRTGVNVIDSDSLSIWSIDVSTSGITLIEFAPAFDYEIEGGRLTFLDEISSLSDVMKVSMILAPDIPASSGGSIKLIRNKRIVLDYESIELVVNRKFIRYNSSVPAASVLQIRIDHDATDNVDFEFFARIYRRVPVS